ncbi:MAG TPA: hypothetical protein VE086_02420, partial [Chthoniobacterales bacterium]|nr:hypothetical protein [Chthoniobacterales bacterium]
WPQILESYEQLKRMSDNPMVMLNYAIAAAMVHGPSKGLALLHALDRDRRVTGHHRLDAVRAHLLEAGRRRSSRDHAVRDRGGTDDERTGTELPDDAGCPLEGEFGEPIALARPNEV